MLTGAKMFQSCEQQDLRKQRATEALTDKHQSKSASKVILGGKEDRWKNDIEAESNEED